MAINKLLTSVSRSEACGLMFRCLKLGGRHGRKMVLPFSLPTSVLFGLFISSYNLHLTSFFKVR